MLTPPPLAQTVAAFDRRSATYDRSVMHRTVAARVAAVADLGPGRVLLDVAGGTGLVAKAVRARQPRATVVVLDASPGMLAAAGRDVLRVRGDAHHLPVRDGGVHVVSVVTALHLVPDPTAVLAEARRVATERVVFTSWAQDGWSVRRLLQRVAAEHDVVVPDPYAHRGTEQAVRALAAQAGLTDVDARLCVSTEPHRPLHDDALLVGLPAAVVAGFRAAFAAEQEVEHRLWVVSGRP